MYSADAIGSFAPVIINNDASLPTVDTVLDIIDTFGAPSFMQVNHYDDSVPKGGDRIHFADLEANPLESTISRYLDETKIEHIVFVDASLQDLGAIGNSISPDTTQVVLVPAESDGLLMVSETLARYSHLQSVQIISHGAEGQFDLGKTQINADLLQRNEAAIKQWASALTDDADILLYGCDIVSSHEGESFVALLSSLTQADVAASVDKTGHSSLGGDWVLEYQEGSIESNDVIGYNEIQQWYEILATIEVDVLTDQFSIADGTTLDDLLVLQQNGKDVSLREAVYAAQQEPGVADTIQLPAGIYQLTLTDPSNPSDPVEDIGKYGDLDIYADTRIEGAGSDQTTIQQTLGDRIIEVVSGNLEFEGITMTGGDSLWEGGAVKNDGGGNLVIRDSVITDNLADLQGGGVYSNGPLQVERTTISDNTTLLRGGGIAAEDDLVLDDVDVLRNAAAGTLGGGGIYVEGNSMISLSRIQNNIAETYGGGIQSSGELLISNSNISSNNAMGQTQGGGGIYTSGTLQINDTTVANNETASHGGGVLTTAPATIDSSIFLMNNASADDGGAIHAVDLTVTRSDLSSNTSSNRGGAVFASGDLNISETRLANNQSTDRGGAVFVEGDLSANSITLSNNESNSVGGGAYGESTSSFANSTFESNTAQSNAGAIYSEGALTVSNTTLITNRSQATGGAVFGNATVLIEGSTFTNNTSNTGGAVNAESRLTVNMSTFIDNESQGAGGAVYAAEQYALSNSTFDSNLSESGRGGAVFGVGNGEISGSAFTNNETNDSVMGDGGAIYAGGEIVVNGGSTFESNEASNDGGAIYGDDQVFVDDAIFTTNISGQHAGAILSLASAQVKNATFFGNDAQVDGGALYSVQGYRIESTVFELNESIAGRGGAVFGVDSGEVRDTSFTDNEAGTDGGALYNQGETTIERSLFQGNGANNSAGAVYSQLATVVSDSGFTRNLATQNGGAIYSNNTLSIVRSSFDQNVAALGIGGALYNDQEGALTIRDTTFSNNGAQSGGAIYLNTTNSGSATGFTGTPGVINSSTFVGNTANTQGAAVWADGRFLRIGSSLFHNNVTADSTSPFSGSVPVAGLPGTGVGPISSGGNNVTDVVLPIGDPTDIVVSDPLIGPMTLYNGHVSAHALLAGSPAINAGFYSGLPIAYDAVGNLRDEITDSGAFEYDSDESVVYWSDVDGNVYLSDSSLDYVIPLLDSVPNSALITYDSSVEALYVLDIGNSEIGYYDANGIYSSNTVENGLQDATSFIVDGASNEFYVAFSGANPHISRYDLTSNELLATVVVAGAGVVNPTDLAINKNTNRLIWVEQTTGGRTQDIRSTNLSGGDLRIEWELAEAADNTVPGPSEIPPRIRLNLDELRQLDIGLDTITVRSGPTNTTIKDVSYEFTNDTFFVFDDVAKELVSIDGETQLETGRHSVSASIVDIDSNMTATVTAKPENTANTPLQIDEGDFLAIMPSHLDSSDSDNNNDTIEYVVTDNFQYGTLIVNNSLGIRNFTQADINAGNVLYEHNGEEEFVDQLWFKLSDGVHETSRIQLNVEITPVNDRPVMQAGSAEQPQVEEGGDFIFTSDILNASDPDTDQSLLGYAFVEPLSAGELWVGGVPHDLGVLFQQQYIDNGQVIYRHDGSEAPADDMHWVVHDRTDYSEDQTIMAFLTLPINDAPLLSVPATAVELSEGSSIALNSSMLLTTDPDNTADDFSYRYVSTALSGRLQVEGLDINLGDEFTHQQLQTGAVAYVHDGTESDADSLGLLVNDGEDVSSEETLALSITPVNDAPQVLPQTGDWVVDEGGVFTLQPQHIQVVDSDSQSTNFVYRYHSSAAGTVEVNGVVLEPSQQFTQDQLLSGLVVYRHDGSEHEGDAIQPASVEVTVLDGISESDPYTLFITVEAVNDAPTLHLANLQIDVQEAGIYTFSVDDFVVSDPDTDEIDLSLEVVELPVQGSLYAAGELVSFNDSIPITTLQDGLLEYRHSGQEPASESFSVKISDQLIQSETVTVSIAIDPVNDLATVVLNSEMVPENHLGAQVGELIVVDEDVGDTAVLAVLDERFILEGQQLMLQPQVAFDYEEEARVEVDIRVTDQSGTPVIVPVVVNVGDQNDLPTIIDLPREVNGEDYQLSLEHFIDEDGDSISFSARQSNGDVLPEWLEFDSEERRFIVVDATAREMEFDVLLTVEDSQSAEVEVAITLLFDPPLAAANPIDIDEFIPSLPSPKVSSEPAQRAEEKPTATVSAPAPKETAKEITPEIQPSSTESETGEEPGAIRADGQLSSQGALLNEFEFEGVHRKVDVHELVSPVESFGSLKLASVSSTLAASVAVFQNTSLLQGVDIIDLSSLMSFDQTNQDRTVESLSRAWDKEQPLQNQLSQFDQPVMGTTAGVSTGISVGYLLWLIRGGTLMGSVLSALPAWRFVDPLPILASLEDQIDEDDESLESMVDSNSDSSDTDPPVVTSIQQQ